MKKKNLIFIINKPKDSHIDNGHHKDFNNMRYIANKYGFKVSNLNLSPLSIKKIWQLIILLFIKREERIITGPIFRLPFLAFLPFRKPLFIYIADSPLKTAVISNKNKLRYVFSIIYNIFLERIIRSDFKIVVTPEERIWYTSKLKSLHKTIILPPIPYQLSKPKSINSTSKDYDILFYNPRGEGVKLMLQIIKDLDIKTKEELKIVIIGKINNKKINFKKLYKKFKISIKEYQSNIDLLICRAKCVIITDIGGSGFCNRAMQVRYLGSTLFSTLDGIRGTNLHPDKGVVICHNANEFVNSLIEFLNNDKYFYIDSKESELYISLAKKELKKFITKLEKM